MAKKQQPLERIYNYTGLDSILSKSWTKGEFVYNVGDFWCNGYVILKANIQIEEFIDRKMFRHDIDINVFHGERRLEKSKVEFEKMYKEPLLEASISDFKFNGTQYTSCIITTEKGNFLINEEFMKPFSSQLQTFASISENKDHPPSLIFKHDDQVVGIVLPIKPDEEDQRKIDQIKHEPRK